MPDSAHNVMNSSKLIVNLSIITPHIVSYGFKSHYSISVDKQQMQGIKFPNSQINFLPSDRYFSLFQTEIQITFLNLR